VFIVLHQVHWPSALAMMAGGILGGFAGPLLARRVPQSRIKALVIAVGLCMTAYFFYR
jgi:hypothetical protein